jgi:hypothetical protein
LKLFELYACIEAIYRAGWQDCLEGRKFDPQIPKYLESKLPDIRRGSETVRNGLVARQD